MKLAVVGATGMVGEIMLKVLEERNFSISKILLVASARSVGKTISYRGENHNIIGLQDAVNEKPDIAIFSAGGSTSLEWAPKFEAVGTTVIDNSSAWRMSPKHKLIIPEINAHELTKNDKIIANPNCSTIQLLMILKPLHDKYNINRVVVSTYQSVSGTGIKAVQQMASERKGETAEMVYHYPIDKNCIPHCDVFEDNGYTKEEMKLTNETKKILSDDSVKLTATAVRVPVEGGHSESVNITFENDFDVSELRKILHEMPGVIVQDNMDTHTYPMPRFAHHKDEVFVGRIRRDHTLPNSLNLWIVSDNLRKGAATNAVQIAEYLVKNNLV